MKIRPLDDDELPEGFVETVQGMVDRIKPILAGHSAAETGMVLVDLLSTWFAGHVVAGDVVATRRLRRDLLRSHNEVMPELIAIAARELGLAE